MAGIKHELSNLSPIAFQRELYASDGINIIRTIPTKGGKVPFVAYLKMGCGKEIEVDYSINDVAQVLSSGYEITKEDYDKSDGEAVNRL
ncbi:MAG: hypothetical protein WC926_04695 [Candidatus Paceibacterota bacterium]|jgi:hypothetical protein|nr:hypothetical protein [Candidatus Omnitrophota bacterium]